VLRGADLVKQGKFPRKVCDRAAAINVHAMLITYAANAIFLSLRRSARMCSADHALVQSVSLHQDASPSQTTLRTSKLQIRSLGPLNGCTSTKLIAHCIINID
jgi:hypothetical protein